MDRRTLPALRSSEAGEMRSTCSVPGAPSYVRGHQTGDRNNAGDVVSFGLRRIKQRQRRQVDLKEF